MSEYSRHREDRQVPEPEAEVEPEVSEDTQPVAAARAVDPNAPAEVISRNTFETNPERMQAWIDYQRELGDEAEVERVQKILDAYNASQQ